MGGDLDSKTALHIAARENLRHAVKYLLEMLQEQTFIQTILDFPEPGTRTTPLIDACKAGNLEIVEALCAAGAKWYLPDSMGVQPRQHAERSGSLEILAFFNAQKKDMEIEGGAFQFEDQNPPLDDSESTAAAEVAEEGAATEGNEASAEQEGASPRATVEASGNDGEEARMSGSQAPSPLPSPQATEGPRTGKGRTGSGSRRPCKHEESPGSRPSKEEESPLVYLSPRQAEEVMRVLCNVSFFPALDAPSLKELSRLCQKITLAPGETLCKDGDDLPSMFIVVRGKIIAEVRRLESLPPHPERQWSIRYEKE
jgi:ankyrin repeat protein